MGLLQCNLRHRADYPALRKQHNKLLELGPHVSGLIRHSNSPTNTNSLHHEISRISNRHRNL